VAAWEQRELGQLAELRGRIGWRGLTAKEYTETGPLFLSVHSLNYGAYVDFRDAFHITEERYVESPEIMLKPNDILICKDGAGIGKLGIIKDLPGMATINSSLLLIRSGPRIIPKFLYYCLSSPYFQAIVNSRLNGATTPHLYQRDITEFPIVLPPLSEQRRIVTALDEALDAIGTATVNVERNLRHIQRVPSSAFIALADKFQRRDWMQATVADVALPKKGSIRTGPFGSQLLHGDFTEKGIAVLGIDNAVYNEFRWGKNRFITREKFKPLSRYEVNPGDVLITIMGTCGRCAVVPDNIPRAINTKHLCCITLDPRKCLPAFLHAYFLYHPIARGFLEKRAKGSIMAGLNTGIIKELPVLLPPLGTQTGLLMAFDKVRSETQRLESLYRQKLAALDALKKSLLHQAFTGNL
jgi:type I restriction enzyme, S subunit